MNNNIKQWKYEKALEYEIFKKEEYGFAKEKIRKANCIFDIGWHIWYFSQRCRLYNPKAKIHYFEPIGELYNQAKTNLWKDENIALNNLWVSTKSGKWTISFNQEKTMQSSKYSSFLNPKWTKIDVNFISIKDYLKLWNIQKIDVLKMDIEWMEFEVLSSWWNLERWKIDSLIVEIHILNNEMKSQREVILPKIKRIFWNIKIIKSNYRDEIFIIRAYKNSK